MRALGGCQARTESGAAATGCRADNRGMPRGFVLQPVHRIESGRAVVHLHGVLEDGTPFLVRDTRVVPRFWIRESDTARAPRGVAAAAADRTP